MYRVELIITLGSSHIIIVRCFCDFIFVMCLKI